MDSSVIECPVCMGTFAFPRVLCCGHSLCSLCISKISNKNNNNLTCPICTKVSNTENIPLNYSLIDVIDKIREHNLELSEIFGICDEDKIIFVDCEYPPDEEVVTCCCFEYSR